MRFPWTCFANKRLMYSLCVGCRGQIAHGYIAVWKQTAIYFYERRIPHGKGLRNHLKQCTRKGDEKSIEETKARIAEISKEMKSCRKEIELCTVIAKRSARVQENLEQLKQQETERKEKTTDELLVRRSSRTGRENDPQRS